MTSGVARHGGPFEAMHADREGRAGAAPQLPTPPSSARCANASVPQSSSSLNSAPRARMSCTPRGSWPPVRPAGRTDHAALALAAGGEASVTRGPNTPAVFRSWIICVSAARQSSIRTKACDLPGSRSFLQNPLSTPTKASRVAGRAAAPSAIRRYPHPRPSQARPHPPRLRLLRIGLPFDRSMSCITTPQPSYSSRALPD
jgi:hypothetical protein